MGIAIGKTRALRARVAGSALGAIALILAACGGDDGTTTETDPGTGDAVDATVSVGDGGDLGDILVDSDGNTLYIAEGESGDNILCAGPCLSAWPPLTVPADEEPISGDSVDGTLSTVTRDDGTVQVTFDGLPLYTFASDSGPGDVTGHGFIDQLTWHAVTPSGPAPLDSAEEDDGGIYDD
jgi:predicted lipoprotein with Yx(FWY)xxD motif